MEQPILKNIKTSIIRENSDECYLNPKDNIINEHYNQLLFKNLSSNLLFYLPLNELLVLVLEEKLIIYDLKISITENLRILDEIFYTKDIINCFKENTNKIENEKTKNDKNKVTNYFLGLNFIDKEQEDKQIKNIVVSDEFFDTKGNFVIIIEFMNLDIYIIKYNLLYEINGKDKITFISKISKNMFIDININGGTFTKLEENLCKNTSKINIKIVKFSNKNIFILFHHNNNLYIYDFIINEITQNKNNKLKNYKISLKNEINYLDANYCGFLLSNYFEIIVVTMKNEIYYYLFFIKHNQEFGNKYEQKICEEINLDSKSNISDIKYYKEKLNCGELFNEKIFFVIQLNRIFIIKYCIQKDKNNLRMNIYYKYLINIVEFEEEKIYNIFLFQQRFFYAFTRKNNYIEYIIDLNKLKNNKNIEEIEIKEKPKYFQIAKFIYDIKPFQSENGFFLLVTQYPVRPINMNIIYKIINTNIIPIKNNFSEILILSLRNSQKEPIINKESNNFYLYNKRYEYFINKIYKGQNHLLINKKDEMEIEEIHDDNNIEEDIKGKNDDLMNVNCNVYKKGESQSLIENNKIKYDLISFFHKKFEKSIKNDEYLKYLNNDKYKCEFCGEVFQNYDKEEMVYKCKNDEITFSCCISFKPINDNFNWCSYCNLFYSEEINIFYCIICDRILTKLDSI